MPAVHQIENRPYRNGRGSSDNLELGQDPDVVDELGGHVHEVLIGPTGVHRAPGDGEDVIGIEFGLGLVAGEADIGHGRLEFVLRRNLLPSGKKYLAI